MAEYEHKHRWQPVVELACAYSAMVVAQTSGPQVIGLLHGEEARRAASAPPDADILPSAPLEQLCASYERHHHDPLSNCLHAAGCLLAAGALAAGVCSATARVRRRLALGSVLPLYYLYAWAGHFFVQRDIPAVFTYGMTLRGWASGEFCSVKALVMGRTVRAPRELLLTAAITLLHAAYLRRAWGAAASVPVPGEKRS